MADRKAQKKRRAELEAKIRSGQAGGAFPRSDDAWRVWLKKNTGTKLLKDGSKQTVWKTGESKGQAFDAKKGKDLWRQDYYGTKTPLQDLKYLKQLDTNELRINRLRSNKLRTAASQRDWEGKNIHQLEVDQLEERLAKEAEELKVGSSYATPTDNLQIEPKNNKNNNNEVVETDTTGGTREGTNEVKENTEEVVTKTYEQNRAKNNQSNEVGNSDLETPPNPNDLANKTNNTSSREKLTARERMRAENVERFGGGEAGEWHVSKVGERHEAWKEARKGGKEAMAEFRKPENYGENLGQYLANERHKLKIDPKKKKKVSTK